MKKNKFFWITGQHKFNSIYKGVQPGRNYTLFFLEKNKGICEKKISIFEREGV